MIQITYKGTDITTDVSINTCYHDMYAAGRTDTLNLRVNDVHGIWDSWAPQIGDEIQVDYGTIGTGTMFLTAATPRNGTYDLSAMSAPSSGFDVQNKSWQQVTLLQLGQEIAARNGLSFESYGVSDHLYPYIQQARESDFHFLHRRAAFEGCAFLVYDKRLILYSEPYMEAQEASETLTVTVDGDYRYIDHRGLLYGSCEVASGGYTGTYAVSNGANRVYKAPDPGRVGSNAEAERFAKGLLRSVNKGCLSGFVHTRILPGYAAGSVVEMSNARAPSWDGRVILDHVRNDYGRGMSKVFFRRPLEGY